MVCLPSHCHKTLRSVCVCVCVYTLYKRTMILAVVHHAAAQWWMCGCCWLLSDASSSLMMYRIWITFSFSKYAAWHSHRSMCCCVVRCPTIELIYFACVLLFFCSLSLTVSILHISSFGHIERDKTKWSRKRKRKNERMVIKGKQSRTKDVGDVKRQTTFAAILSYTHFRD